MDYEKKYKELEGKIKKAYLYAQTDSTKAVLEDILPELCESEDEKIRKELIEHIKANQETDYVLFQKFPPEDVIAWLEKLKVFAEHGYGLYYFANNGFAYVGNPTGDNVSWIEKQGDKPQGKTAIEAVKEEKADNANKIEPKFHEGEWIVWENQYYKVNYNGCGYELVDQNGLKTSLEYGTIDESAHLWDITKDAKDGDVLYSLDSNQPFIYQKRNVHEQATAYCGINKYGKFFVWNTKDCIIALDKYVPATKEQRDALFVEMGKAGYIFDFDKKELKEIEQKSVWSEEDEKNCLGIIDEIAVNKSEAPESDYKTYDRFIDWLKSLKDKVQFHWKPSDEQMLALEAVLTVSPQSPAMTSALIELYEQFKKLREE